LPSKGSLVVPHWGSALFLVMSSDVGFYVM